MWYLKPGILATVFASFIHSGLLFGCEQAPQPKSETTKSAAEEQK